jgi:hypothetical protein
MSYISRIYWILSLLIILSTGSLYGSGRTHNDSIILASIKDGKIEVLVKNLHGEKEINRRYGDRKRVLLSYAIERGQTDISRYLIENGANLEQKSVQKTPLMFAARFGKPDIAKLLLENGADINSINKDRNTAFHYAAKYNRLDVLKILYEYKALINIPNNDQWTALDYSIINNRKEIEKYLRTIGCILFEKDLPNYFDGPYIDILVSGEYRVKYLENKRGKKGSRIISKDYTVPESGLQFKGLKKDRKEYKVQPDLTTQVSVYKEPSKIFVMGDVHGQYKRLVEMLTSGGVIDKNQNWIWGVGHLVFVGDISDRGEQVIEAYWLIYKLEQQARDAKGYVHLLFGNHEAMIIKDDIRYIANKYYGLTSNLDLKYYELFSENTFVGKWLRTKNCVEIIGNTMFVHAGISPELAAKGLSVEEINENFRAFIRNTKEDQTELEKFMISNLGPVWYRGYIKESSGYEEISQSELESILKQYGVNRVVVGHTEVELIEPLKEDKVIPVNIPLADKEVIGQALLIENNVLYRISTDKTKSIITNQK